MIYSTDVSSYGWVYTDVRHFHLNPNDPYFILLSQLLLKQVCNRGNGRVTLARKIQTIKIFSGVYRTNISINWLYKIPACSVNLSQ